MILFWVWPWCDSVWFPPRFAPSVWGTDPWRLKTTWPWTTEQQFIHSGRTTNSFIHQQQTSVFLLTVGSCRELNSADSPTDTKSTMFCLIWNICVFVQRTELLHHMCCCVHWPPSPDKPSCRLTCCTEWRTASSLCGLQRLKKTESAEVLMSSSSFWKRLVPSLRPDRTHLGCRALRTSSGTGSARPGSAPRRSSSAGWRSRGSSEPEHREESGSTHHRNKWGLIRRWK